jgi:fructose-1,6-bisphosphatase/inositol monophosphatase family enzyme
MSLGKEVGDDGADELLALLDSAADAVVASLSDLRDWGLAETRPHQYQSDLVADAALRDVLDPAGVGVLSEESGLRGADAPVVVIADPVDGSTNASLGIPWFATSLCAVDARGPVAAVVVNIATGERFDARRGTGARRDGQAISPTTCTEVAQSIIGLSGFAPRYFGWRQYRTLGAAALDLCAVACGRLDGYVDCSFDAHGVWDYAAGVLICDEAGATIVDASGRALISLDPSLRRTPVAAATQPLSSQLLAARASFDSAGR